MSPFDRPSEQEVWEQYARIVAYQRFRKAPELQKLLKKLVEFWLAGKDELGEVTLGEAMGETPVPSHRVTAENHGYPNTRSKLRHVRVRLIEYYETDGYAAPVIIKVNSGYSIVIQHQKSPMLLTSPLEQRASV